MDATIKVELLKLAATQAMNVIESGKLTLAPIDNQKVSNDAHGVNKLTDYFYKQYLQHIHDHDENPTLK